MSYVNYIHKPFLATNMKIGIIIEQGDPETVWNALRFANRSLQKGHRVSIFRIGKGVVAIKSRKYNITAQLQSFITKKGIIYACGTCIKSHKAKVSQVCPISTMDDLVRMVEKSDRIVTF